MISKDQIDAIGITVEAEGIQRFMIFLSADGNVKRSGTGRMMDTKDDLYMGQSSEPMFKNVMNSVGEGILNYVNKEIDLPNPQGILCKLTIQFNIEGAMQRLVINYGHQSGYPDDIVMIVKAAFEATQPWYEKMKMGQEPKKKKGFWPFK